MAISVVNVSSNSIAVADTSLNINYPASLAIGDVVVAGIAIDGGSNNTMTLPVGWVADLNYDRTTALKLLICHRVIDGTEGASATWQSNVSNLMCGVVVGYRGVDTGTVFEVAPTGANGSSATATHPGATSLSNNARFVWGLAIDGTGTTTTDSTGFATQASIDTGRGAEIQDKAQASPASSGALSSTLGVSRQWATGLGVLKEAVAALPRPMLISVSTPLTIVGLEV